MSDVQKTVSFPDDLWARVEDRAYSLSGMPMRWMNTSYLVAVLVKRGLDELDELDTEEKKS